MDFQTKFDIACTTAQDFFGLKRGKTITLKTLARATVSIDEYVEREIGQPVTTTGRFIDSPQIPGQFEWEITFETENAKPYIAVIDIPDDKVEGV